MTACILLESDQTSCFDENGSPIDCFNSGQDGELRAFRQNRSQRFVASDKVVLDLWTGMFWHANANLAEFPLTWEEAFEFVADLNRMQESGRSDWRLPDRDELFSLISHQHINPALPENHPFSNVFHGYYWTGTPCARLPGEAWYIHMGGGRIYRGMQHSSYLVWPVAGDRLASDHPKNRFVSEADTVYDQSTGKWWLRTYGPPQNPLTWGQALDQIKRLNHTKAGGFADWRLPSIRELESLVDCARHSPALAPGSPIPDALDGFWSATTSIYDPRYAWVLYTPDGAVGVGYKSQRDFFLSAIR